MTGILHRKYHIAICECNPNVLNQLVKIIKGWFKNKAIIKAYTTPDKLFIDINMAKVKNKPFDYAILGPDERIETAYVLKKTEPKVNTIQYKNDIDLKKEILKKL